jgi:hypothetical protein
MKKNKELPSKVLVNNEEAISKLTEAAITGGHCRIYSSNIKGQRFIIILVSHDGSWIVPIDASKCPVPPYRCRNRQAGDQIPITEAIHIFMECAKYDQPNP